MCDRGAAIHKRVRCPLSIQRPLGYAAHTPSPWPEAHQIEAATVAGASMHADATASDPGLQGGGISTIQHRFDTETAARLTRLWHEYWSHAKRKQQREPADGVAGDPRDQRGQKDVCGELQGDRGAHERGGRLKCAQRPRLGQELERGAQR